jgi:ribosomal protein S4
VAGTRLNRYLALAGLGTRRSVEGLVRAGRVAVDGVVAEEPSTAVEPGSTVTLDGTPVVTEGPAGVLVALVHGAVPEIAHPSELHLAGTSPDGRLGALISDERLARRLRALGYDPGRLGGAHPEDGGFRPLDNGEMDAARGLARSYQRTNAREREASEGTSPEEDGPGGSRAT